MRSTRHIGRLALTPLALLFAAVAANAAQVTAQQTCGPLEVIFSSASQNTDYALACRAGSWHVNYAGTLPQGVGRAVASYKLEARSDSGANVSLARSVSVANPALLGTVLRSEAAELSGGALGVRTGKDYEPVASTGETSAQPAAAAGVIAYKVNEALVQNQAIAAVPVPASRDERPAQAAQIQSLTERIAVQNAQIARLTAQNEALAREKTELLKRLDSSASELAAAKAKVATDAPGASRPRVVSPAPVAAVPLAVPTPTQAPQTSAPKQAASATPTKVAATASLPQSGAAPLDARFGRPTSVQTISVGGRPAITIRTFTQAN